MDQPHVLLFVCDQMQYQRQSKVDPVAVTPNLNRLADEGVFFTHYHCANGQCVPSRASMQTGLYPHEAEVMIIYGFHGHSAHITGDQRTMGHVFRDAGYATAYFGKTHFGTPLGELGYDIGGKGRKTARPLSVGDGEIVQTAIDFLEGYDPGTPLFLTVSVNMPHPPFELVERWADRYPIDRIELPKSFYEDDLSDKPQFLQDHIRDGQHGALDEEDLRNETRQYYTMVSEVDRLLGEVRTAFERKGMWDHTVAAFVSDHGDMMGAHRMRKKGTIPYDEIFRIPFVLKLPGNAHSGSTIDALGVNVSLPGTLIGAAGMEVPASFKGGSMMPIVRGDEEGPDHVFFEHYGAYWGIHPFRAIRTREWKYVRYYGDDSTEELYHLLEDPNEITNLAGKSDHSDLQQQLRGRVDRWWDETNGKSAAYYASETFKTRGGDLEALKAVDDTDRGRRE